MDGSTPMLTQATLVKLKGPENKPNINKKTKAGEWEGGVLFGKSEMGGVREAECKYDQNALPTCMK